MSGLEWEESHFIKLQETVAEKDLIIEELKKEINSLKLRIMHEPGSLEMRPTRYQSPNTLKDYNLVCEECARRSKEEK